MKSWSIGEVYEYAYGKASTEARSPRRRWETRRSWRPIIVRREVP